MKKEILTVIGACVILGVSAWGGSREVKASEAPEGVSFVQNISYMNDENEDHMLDVYTPADSGKANPVIIEVHGGGYIGGNKEINSEHSEFYAENGFSVVNVNYTHLPEGNFKTVVQELFTVLNWVEENQEAYNFDLDNVFMSGDSAGGFFVNLMAAVLTNEEEQQYYEVSPADYEIKGYVLSCPGTDIMALRDGLNEEGPAGFTAKSIGEEILMDDEIMGHADLYSIINKETFPEVYILTTPTDSLLYNEAVKYDQILSENNIAHVYKEYVGKENEIGHVFNIKNMDYAESIEANQDIVSYLQEKIGQ